MVAGYYKQLSKEREKEIKIMEQAATIAALREEVEKLQLRLVLFKCKDCSEMEVLRARIAELEGRVERAIAYCDGGFIDYEVMQDVKQILEETR